jgi:hypothetical protein
VYSIVKSKSTTTRNVMNLFISCVEYFMKIENDDEDHNHDTILGMVKKRIPRGKPHENNLSYNAVGRYLSREVLPSLARNIAHGDHSYR